MENRSVGPQEGMHVLGIQFIAGGLDSQDVDDVGLELQVVAGEGLNERGVVGLFVKGIDKAGATVFRRHVGADLLHIREGGRRLQVVVVRRLRERHNILLVGHVHDAGTDFLHEGQHERRSSDVAGNGFLQDRDCLPIGYGCRVQQLEQFLIGERVQPAAEGRDGTRRGQLAHVLAVVDDFLNQGRVVIVVVVIGSLNHSGFLAEEQVRMLFDCFGNKDVQGRVKAQECLYVRRHMVEDEPGNRGFVQGCDIALVIARADNAEVGRQLNGADGPQGGNRQGFRGYVRGRSVQLVQEQDGHFPGMGLGVLNGVVNDGVGIEHLLVGGLAGGCLNRHQSGAGKVGLVRKLVAGESEALCILELCQGLNPAGLANARLAKQHRDASVLQVLAYKCHECSVEFHCDWTPFWFRIGEYVLILYPQAADLLCYPGVLLSHISRDRAEKIRLCLFFLSKGQLRFMQQP